MYAISRYNLTWRTLAIVLVFINSYKGQSTQVVNRICSEHELCCCEDGPEYMEQLFRRAEQTNNDAEAESARLRSHMEELSGDVSDVVSDLASIQTQLDNLNQANSRSCNAVASIQSQVNETVDRINRVSTNLTTFERELASARVEQIGLGTNLSLLQTQVSVVSEENDWIRTNLSEINRDNNDMHSNLAELQRELVGVKNVVDRLPQRFADFDSRLTELNGQYTQLSGKLSSLEDEVSITVAFTVYPRFRREYRSNRVVMFDGVLSNVGRHYDIGTNRFSCPRRGLYAFSLSLHTPAGSFVNCAIQKGDNTIAYALADQGGDRHKSHTSTFVLTECNRGQAVVVKTLSSNGEILGNLHSTFSGFLIRRLP